MQIFPVYIRRDKQHVIELLKQVAKREGRPVSDIIVSLAEDYVVRHGSGNPAFTLDKWLENPSFIAFPTLGEPPTMARLLKMPRKILLELRRNAETYYVNADHLLRYLDEHENRHVKLGYKDQHCPYCTKQD